MAGSKKRKYRRILLNGRRYTMVDIRDYVMLMKFNKWFLKVGENGKEYATNRKTINGKHTHYNMARVIMRAPKGMEVDHRNGNTLDNRRRNLRVCTRAQNGCNIKKQPGKGSKYKGVKFCKRSNRWIASIRIKGIKTLLRICKSERLAAKIYNVAAKKHHGEYAWLNRV